MRRWNPTFRAQQCASIANCKSRKDSESSGKGAFGPACTLPELETFRGNHAFDPEKVLATELHIALDKNFLPIEHPDDDERSNPIDALKQ